jgi:hypothetical protein
MLLVGSPRLGAKGTVSTWMRPRAVVRKVDQLTRVQAVGTDDEHGHCVRIQQFPNELTYCSLATAVRENRPAPEPTGPAT